MYSANNKIFYKNLKTRKIKETILSFSATDWWMKTAVIICLGYSKIFVYSCFRRTSLYTHLRTTVTTFMTWLGHHNILRCLRRWTAPAASTCGTSTQTLRCRQLQPSLRAVLHWTKCRGRRPATMWRAATTQAASGSTTLERWVTLLRLFAFKKGS